MTVSDLPVEGPGPGRVHPTTSSTQPASQKPIDTGGAAARSWTRSSRPLPDLGPAALSRWTFVERHASWAMHLRRPRPSCL